jgi:hypothetical protein
MVIRAPSHVCCHATPIASPGQVAGKLFGVGVFGNSLIDADILLSAVILKTIKDIRQGEWME